MNAVATPQEKLRVTRISRPSRDVEVLAGRKDFRDSFCPVPLNVQLTDSWDICTSLTPQLLADSNQRMSGGTNLYNGHIQSLSLLYQDLYKYSISFFLFHPLVEVHSLPYSYELDTSEAKQVFSCPYTS
jgi:hypothetical protein